MSIQQLGFDEEIASSLNITDPVFKALLGASILGIMEHIIERIHSEATVNLDSIHGPSHWQRVAHFGSLVAKQEPVDIKIILLFAYFHDCQRLSDGSDPHHGIRAGEYVNIFSEDELGLTQRDIDRLVFACNYHTYEQPTTDLTILACWDSDRLDLGRVGIQPHPQRLFTSTAKEIAMTY